MCSGCANPLIPIRCVLVVLSLISGILVVQHISGVLVVLSHINAVLDVSSHVRGVMVASCHINSDPYSTYHGMCGYTRCMLQS